MRARLAALLLAALAASGCIRPGSELDLPSSEPLPDLAEPAAPLPEPTTTPPAAGDIAEGEPAPPGDVEPEPAAPAPTEPAPPTPAAPPADESQPEPPAPAAPEPAPEEAPQEGPPPEAAPEPRPDAAPVVMADVADPTRDAGLEAPAYGDLTRVLFESVGEGLRVTVEVAGDLPARLADGEVVGLGVNLYAGEGAESDHQLFADGGSDGWRAFLQTPEGFVSYPGSFAMGGRRLVFEVPWSALGGRSQRQADVFLDWSRERLPLNAQSYDRLPDRGRMTLRP